MMQENIHFLLQVLASMCGILLGAAVADTYRNTKNKLRAKRRNRE